MTDTLTDKELENVLVEVETTDDELADAPVATFFDDGKPLVPPLATYLISKRYVKTITGIRREIYVYKDGVYVIGEDILKKDVRRLFGSACANRHVDEAIEMIKDLTTVDRDTFVEDIHLINLNNGVLDLRSGAIYPHDPRYLFLSKIPVNFNPTADCPTIKRYLADVLDEEGVLHVQEWSGYGLYREYPFKRATILVGEGDTGKTTLISLWIKFFGLNNVSGVSLQKLSSDKFAASQLYGKLVNLVDELAFKDIQDNGAFKVATGGGVITGEKKFRDQFLFNNYSKLTFACNKIPEVKDATDDAYFRRWVVVPFNRVIEEEDQDKQLIHKMTTPAELSGFLNFALEGLKRLLENQRFSYSKEIDEVKTAMMRSGSPIAQFAADCLMEDPDAWIKKEEAYQIYARYARKNILPVTSMKTFSTRLTIYAPYISDFKPTDSVTGRQVGAWRNVRVKPVEGAETPLTEPSNNDEQPLLIPIS